MPVRAHHGSRPGVEARAGRHPHAQSYTSASRRSVSASRLSRCAIRSPSVVLSFAEPVYVSLDLDALDPAFAPGVSHHEPGGLSTRDVIGLLHRLQGRVMGADVVELNPARDLHGVTAMAAARLVKELAGRMLTTD